jgi:hypothetical protein
MAKEASDACDADDLYSPVAIERDPVIETPALSGREHSRVDQDGAAYRDHLASVEHATGQLRPRVMR